MLAAAVASGTGAGLLVAAVGLAVRTARRPAMPGAARPWRDRALIGLIAVGSVFARSIPGFQRPSVAETVVRRSLLVGESTALTRVVAHPSGDPPTILARLAALRSGAMIAGCAALLAAAVVAPGIALTLAPVVLVGGFVAPDVALAASARRAQAECGLALPGLLDLLAAALRAGFTLEPALLLSGQHTAGPLQGVVARVVARQRSGQAAPAALRVEAERTGVETLVSLAQTIERHHELGLPLEGTLLHLADAARAEAHVAAMTRASRAVPIASLVTAMVTTPACVIAIGTAIVATLLASGVI